MKLKHIALMFVPIFLVGSLATGCSVSASSKNTSKKLVFYSSQGYDSAIAKAFQKKTGIKVQLVDDSTGNLLAKIEAEKNNPHWDIIWCDGDVNLQAMDNEGLLQKNWTPNDISNLNALGKTLVPSDDAYFPTGTTAAAAIGVNTTLLSAADYPKDWSDLLSSTFKDSLAMNDPAFSGPTYPYIAGMLQKMGQSTGEKFYTSLKSNGLKVFSTNDTTLQALLKGQVKAVTIQDCALIKAKVSGSPIDIVYPKSGVSTLPSVIGIDKKAPDSDAAKEFVEYIYTTEAQKVMLNVKNGGGDSYFNPVITGVKADDARLQAEQNGIKWNKLNAVKAAKNIDSVKAWFHENIVQ